MTHAAWLCCFHLLLFRFHSFITSTFMCVVRAAKMLSPECHWPQFFSCSSERLTCFSSVYWNPQLWPKTERPECVVFMRLKLGNPQTASKTSPQVRQPESDETVLTGSPWKHNINFSSQKQDSYTSCRAASGWCAADVDFPLSKVSAK